MRNIHRIRTIDPTFGRLLKSLQLLEGVRRRILSIASLLVFSLVAFRNVSCIADPAINVPKLEWVRQLGTSSTDFSLVTSVDSAGNVYIAGLTSGSIGGQVAGGEDAFVAKYDSAGGLLWTKQLGTSGNDLIYGVAVNLMGSPYLVGTTGGSLAGAFAGAEDTFVTKLDASGNLLWSRQFGTTGYDVAFRACIDTTENLYISGFTTGNLGAANAGNADAFVRSYDAAGNVRWTRQLGGASDDRGFGVSADMFGNVYMAGNTDGNLGGPKLGGTDILVAKLDQLGNILWTRQFGSSQDEFGTDVSVDSLGNIFVTGYTSGNVAGTNKGLYDAFLAKYDTAGNLAWTRQFGTNGDDEGDGLSVDGLGNAYVTGIIGGSALGPWGDAGDAFLAKYDSLGNLIWIRQFGTSNFDVSFGVAANGFGGVYTSGRTTGNLGGTNAGDSDAFVMKFSDVPEPNGMALSGLAFLVGICAERHRRGARIRLRNGDL